MGEDVPLDSATCEPQALPIEQNQSTVTKSQKPSQRQDPERPLEDVTRLNLKVGKIIKIWAHEDADSLFCEEIDLGEEEPRQILSGLRKYYKEDDLLGKSVIVLANMKEKNLRGKKSQGMVMCASNADHTQVEILIPPSGAQPGDKVVFEGLSSELGPDEVLSTKKNKDPLPFILPHLKTNSEKAACWKSHRMLVGGEQCVSSTLADACIS